MKIKSKDIWKKIIVGLLSSLVMVLLLLASPDILACCNGRFLGIEVKQENGKPSPLQKVHLKRIIDAGGIAVLAYPSGYEQLKNLIDNLMKDRDYQIEYNGEDYLEFRSGK